MEKSHLVIAPIATVLTSLCADQTAPPRRLTRQNAVSLRDVTIWPERQAADLGHGMQAALDMGVDPSVSVKHGGHTIWQFMARHLHPWKLVTAEHQVVSDGIMKRRSRMLSYWIS